MAMSILIADDDPVFRELVCDIVRKEGYDAVQASNGQEALDVFFSSRIIDMVILDVMMPVQDGWSVLREIRERSEVPVIMLTALGDDRNVVFGLKKGADDYIAKPFSYPVFIARINALARKLKKIRQAEILAGNIRIIQATHRVTVCDAEIELNRKEYGLLVYFIQNRDVVLTREQLLDKLWGYDFDGDVRTVDTHVKTLRAKLSSCGTYIRTVRGTGYLFGGPGQ
jgi:two-component system, OmpR family, response regulator ResD